MLLGVLTCLLQNSLTFITLPEDFFLSQTVFINTAKERGHFKRILEEDMTFCLKVWAENLVCLWSNIRYFLHITLKLPGRSHYPGSDSFLVCGVWSIIIALSSETSCSLVQSMPSTIHKHSDIRSQDYFKLMLFILAVPDTHTRVAGDGGSMSETVSSFSFHCANNLLCWCVHTCHAFLPRTRKNSNTHTRKSDLHVKVKKKKSTVQDRWEKVPVCRLALAEPCPADSLFLGICHSTTGEEIKHKHVLIPVLLLPQNKGKWYRGMAWIWRFRGTAKLPNKNLEAEVGKQ